MAERPIHAVLVDLDDTVFPQERWLHGAWVRVAGVAASRGIPRDPLLHALQTVSSEGSDRGRVIDRALERIGGSTACVPELVSAFRAYEARHVQPYPGVRQALAKLRSRVRLGLVTDGDPQIQRAKLRALGLSDAFDVVIISDEYGRSKRKPDPYPLTLAAARLCTDPRECVYIGDRPDKDVAAAHAAGMRSVRVRTGEYKTVPDVPLAWLCVRDLPQAIETLSRFLAPVAYGSEGPPLASTIT